MPRARRTDAAGFTLIETMVAMVVVLVASVGALAGLMMASSNIHDAQVRQYKMALLDSHSERTLLANKAALALSAVALPATPPDQLPVGQAPWVPDPALPSPTEPLSTGTYFTVLTSGMISPAAGIAPGTDCGSVPQGVYCREVLMTQGMPDGTQPPAGTAYTLWTRLARKGDPFINAVVSHEVIVQ